MEKSHASVGKKAGAAFAAGCVEGLHHFCSGGGEKVLKIDRPTGPEGS